MCRSCQVSRRETLTIFTAASQNFAARLSPRYTIWLFKKMPLARTLTEPFAPGSWQMRPQGEQIIANLAQKPAPSQQNKIMVSGYTYSAPIGPALQREGVTSNQVLS